MNLHTVLEQKIQARLKSISAHDLQLLAEDIALVRDSERYRGLYGLGRNSEAQTVPGWPDAGVVAADGTIDAVEATREKGDWEGHIADDLAKAKVKPLNGFLFVAGYPTRRVTFEEIALWKRRFQELGIEEQRIDILVGASLVRELTQPRYARTRLMILGIRDCPEHFVMLGAHSTPGRAVHSFEPSEKEYSLGLVHRPKQIDSVMARLRDHGCALIRGRGASGKTVMVHLIAGDAEYRSLPTYYLDLAHWADRAGLLRGSVENAMVEFGGSGTLFAIDNVHLEETFSRDIFSYWQKTASSTGSRLLLVGRETRTRRGSPLDQIAQLPRVVQHAGSDELRGVYRRIVSGAGIPGAEPPDPPSHEVDTWLKTFGGRTIDQVPSADLIAFSAAVRRRRNFLLQGDWRLSEGDAVEEIRVHYLAPLPEPERRNLLRLASLPDDYLLHYVALPERIAAFKNTIQGGVVFESEHGRAQHLRYSLVHSALGHLLVAAAEPGFNRVRECCAVAQAVPAMAMFLARAALTDGDEHLAKEVIRALPPLDWLAAQRGFFFVTPMLRFAASLGFDNYLDADDKRINQALLALALDPPLHGLADFLKYAETKELHLSTLRKKLVADLEEKRLQLLESALSASTPINDLCYFLRYAADRKRGLSSIRDRLIADLETHAPRFCERAVAGSLSGILAFLRYAEADERKLAVLRQRLLEYLSERKAELAKLAVKAPLAALMGFIEVLPFGKDVWDLIDLNDWNDQRNREPPTEPNFIVNFARAVRGPFGRPELAQVPVQVQVRSFNPALGHRPPNYIHQLASLISLAGEMKPGVIARFLDSTVTPDWLARNYTQARLPGLAGSLSSLANHLDPQLHQIFGSPELDSRLAAAAAELNPDYASAWADLISLFGSASVLLGTPAAGIWRIEPGKVAHMLEHRPARNVAEGLNLAAADFWCGLRELRYLNVELGNAPPQAGDDILKTWGDSDRSLPFSVAIRAVMVEWLQECKDADWTLVRPKQPIRQEILHRTSLEVAEA